MAKRRRKAIELKKEIIKHLKKKPMVLRQLEFKVKTNHETIKMQIKELELLEIVKVKRHKRHPLNNRPYTVVTLKKL